MSGAIPPLPQYAFMAWCSVKAQAEKETAHEKIQKIQYKPNKNYK
jgi:hypothetical protein